MFQVNIQLQAEGGNELAVAGKTFSDVFEEMVGVDAIPIGLQVILPSILNHGNPIPPRIREPQEPGTCASEQETLTDGFDTP